MQQTQNTNHCKLRTYVSIKRDNSYPAYLDAVQNRKQKKALVYLRLSCHQLKIESGRYENLQVHQRVCPFCPNKIEDEAHFLLYCNEYENEHKEFFTSILKQGTDIERLSEN